MSPAQDKFYWRLWSGARQAQPALRAEGARHALHAELGLPESHLDFTQKHFDAWKKHCLALAQPGNYRDQVATVQMPRTRRLWLAQMLCQALGAEAGYALGTWRQMRRGRREADAGRAELSLAGLSEEELGDVLSALHEACRRLWPRKRELIRAMAEFVQEQEIEEEAARSAAAEALRLPAAPRLEGLTYDRLLTVMAALRGLARVEVPF